MEGKDPQANDEVTGSLVGPRQSINGQIYYRLSQEHPLAPNDGSPYVTTPGSYVLSLQPVG